MNRIAAASIAVLSGGLVLSACGGSPSASPASSASAPSASAPAASPLSSTAAAAELGRHGEYSGGGPYSTSIGSSPETATALDDSVDKWANANGMVPSSSMPAADLDCEPVGADDNPRPPALLEGSVSVRQLGRAAVAESRSRVWGRLARQSARARAGGYRHIQGEPVGLGGRLGESTIR
jgi:hypothetical protein